MRERAKVRQKRLAASPEIPSAAQKPKDISNNKRRETEYTRPGMKGTEMRSAGKMIVDHQEDKVQKYNKVKQKHGSTYHSIMFS